MLILTKHDVLYVDDRRTIASVILSADERLLTITMGDGTKHDVVVTGLREAKQVCQRIENLKRVTIPPAQTDAPAPEVH